MPFGFDNNGNPFYPSVDLYQFPEASLEDAVIQKKKRSWLDSLTDSMAGDRYTGTTEDDRHLARNQALIELGRAFSAAAPSGSWGAVAQALGTGLGNAGEAFHKTMGGLQRQRQANEQNAYEQEKRKLDLESSKVDAEEKQYTAKSRKEMQEGIKAQLDEWDNTFSEVIGDKDITPQQRKEFTTRLKGLKKTALADPRNPNSFAQMATFMHEVMSAAGESEMADKLLAREMETAAAKAGVSVDEMLSNERLDTNLAQQLKRAQIRASNANAVESQARADYYKAGGSGSDNPDKASIQSVKERLDRLLRVNGGEYATYITAWAADGDIDGDSKKALNALGITSPEQAKDTAAFWAGVVSPEAYFYKWGQGRIEGPAPKKRTPEDNYEPSPEVVQLIKSNPELAAQANTFSNLAQLHAWMRSLERQ